MRRILNGATLLAITSALLLAADGLAAGGPTTSASSVYTVSSQSVPGADTGLVLEDGLQVTVTATGAFCPYGTTDVCVGPDGDPSVDTTDSSFGGFVLPGAPAWGLVGRVGSGPWVQVGSGPTTLSGSGDLVFAVNDDWFVDNDDLTGVFTVTVSWTCPKRSTLSMCQSAGTASVGCYPGYGYGDVNHEHSGPPGLDGTCYPGHGYGDENHDHSGPPGQANRTETSTGGNSKRGGG